MIHSGTGTSRAPFEQFAGVVAMELSSIRALVGVLGEEREALTQGDAEALPEIIARKTRHMDDLARFSAERRGALNAAGIASHSDDIRSFLAASPAALQAWEDLLAAARKAAGLNTANAFLTSTRLASVSRALAALTGAQPDVYGPLGMSPRPAGFSRSLSRG